VERQIFYSTKGKRNSFSASPCTNCDKLLYRRYTWLCVIYTS